MTEREFDRWVEDRERQSKQHPHSGGLNRRGVRWSVGDHYRRKNNGIALRTFRGITRHGGGS